MNIIEILRIRTESLPAGDYSLGLKAVLQHVAVAASHYDRGQKSGDETAFTDAIYRTNQAFEGSIKEAYRVLAGKDPNSVRPFDIENYFQQQDILRDRVLSQFSNYRTQWRNPSTHDYKLDFDDDEALLAIVTVTVFSIVMIDQIVERISYNQVKNSTTIQIQQVKSISFIDQIAIYIEQFNTSFLSDHAGRKDIREVEILGSLKGFLSKVAPEISIYSVASISRESRYRIDLQVSNTTDKIIIELKNLRGLEYRRRIREAIFQVQNYMAQSGINQAIIYGFHSENSEQLVREEIASNETAGRIIVISPQNSSKI